MRKRIVCDVMRRNEREKRNSKNSQDELDLYYLYIKSSEHIRQQYIFASFSLQKKKKNGIRMTNRINWAMNKTE